MKTSYEKYKLSFKQASGTSRGVLTTKETYFIKTIKEKQTYIGECGLFRGLSSDDVPDYEEKLHWVCENISLGRELLLNELSEFPSIQFGVEQLFQAMEVQENDDIDGKTPILFPSDFTRGKKGIVINGLIWMGSIGFMRQQIQTKLEEGYHCIKMKIGVHWEEEHKILQELRSEFPARQLELRVDANGGFSFAEAERVLEQLASLEIHSIEQPIKAHQIDQMQKLCTNTPTPIALDEELIGVIKKENKEALLQAIQPQYIILKPSLLGGWKGSQEWINYADKNNIAWWITSALESNIGLNAIAQWTYTLHNKIPQGLGTGGLYTNNTPSKLVIEKDKLYFKV